MLVYKRRAEPLHTPSDVRTLCALLVDDNANALSRPALSVTISWHCNDIVTPHLPPAVYRVCSEHVNYRYESALMECVGASSDGARAGGT